MTLSKDLNPGVNHWITTYRSQTMPCFRLPWNSAPWQLCPFSPLVPSCPLFPNDWSFISLIPCRISGPVSFPPRMTDHGIHAADMRNTQLTYATCRSVMHAARSGRLRCPGGHSALHDLMEFHSWATFGLMIRTFCPHSQLYLFYGVFNKQCCSKLDAID